MSLIWSDPDASARALGGGAENVVCLHEFAVLRARRRRGRIDVLEHVKEEVERELEARYARFAIRLADRRSEPTTR